MKTYSISVLLLSAVLIFSCTEIPEEPHSAHFDLEVHLQDTTIFSTGSFVSSAGATVVLLSLSDGKRYTTMSDDEGIARFNGVLPDHYSISANRPLSVEEIWEIINRNEMWTLGGDTSNVVLFADPGQTLTLPLHLSRSRAGNLVISEIYYSGSKPDPIPNYFHDQFLEIQPYYL